MATTIAAGEFKAKCLKMLDEVEVKRKTLVITKRGRPVAQVLPMPPKKELFGAMRGSGVIVGDIVSPLESDWEALK